MVSPRDSTHLELSIQVFVSGVNWEKSDADDPNKPTAKTCILDSRTPLTLDSNTISW